ncbi:MAG: DUF4249 family protein [Sporocytophaga sp.]|uniref:DUF4249 family protein n=1 Tax=Sporocytophaga sp. TaxID=2231183 RepID=UPI001B204A8C|nr:DUF4249 family protein [Sporocytophaga sp.]MBO9702930.1 DUF4249 family protein [Sporocytophaga sp.]
MTRSPLLIAFILISIFLISSCIKEADEVAIPTSLKDMKIIVNGFVGRDEAKVSLCQTFPFFNKNGYSFDKQYIKDAMVTISSGKDTVKLYYHDQGFGEISYYSHYGKLPLDFIPGQKIYLNVDLPDGRHVDAVTIVPDTINVIATRIDSMYTERDWIYGYKYVNQSLNSEYALNFYENFKLYEIVMDFSKDTTHNSFYMFSVPRQFMPSDGTYTTSYIYNEKEFASGEISVRYGLSHHLNIISFNKKLKEYILSKSSSNKPIPVDPIKSLDSTSILEEPLFSEPIYYDYYSNINGGLGFFEAYQEKVVFAEK